MISKIYFSEVDQCEGLKLLEKAKYQIERSTEKGFERENDAKRLRERERERKRLTLRKRDGEKGLKRENDAKITVRTGVYLLERERERERYFPRRHFTQPLRRGGGSNFPFVNQLQNEFFGAKMRSKLETILFGNN